MFCSKCGTQLPEEAAFCVKCGNKVAQPSEVAPIPVQEIAVPPYTTSEIKAYLGHAKTLEVNRYTLITAKNRLQQIINTLGKSRKISHPVSSASEGFYSFWSIFWKTFLVGLIICVFVCGDAPDRVFANLLSIVSVALIFFNTELLLGVLASAGIALIFSITVCLIRAGIKKAEYRAAVRDYHRQVDEDNKRVALEREQIKALQKQQRDISNDISRTESILRKLYAFDVIKPKYRELVPIVTMYEYFDYERCYDLVGPAGAYNLFESESRQNIIISNLNQVISMLSRIEQNQHALYEAIQESNYYADSMCNQANNMLKSCKAIEHNTAITAYNSKISAENSAISAYIDMCRL